jgi:phage major head subunit gpT-like protein
MIINGQSLVATYTEQRLAFQSAYSAADAPYEGFTGQETLGKQRTARMYWGGQVPMMRKLIGDVQFDKLDVFNWEVGIDKYAAGIEISRDDFEDDNLGWVSPYIAGLGVEARQHPGREIIKLLENGNNALCYDGQFFFDSDHRDGDGPIQSNLIAGPLNEANLQLMRQTMARLKDMKGRPAPRRRTHIGVPPELTQVAKKLVVAEYGANGASNVEKGAVSVIEIPHLVSPSAWYGFDLSTPFRPFMLFWRAKPEYSAQDSLTDEQAFLREIFRYKVRSRVGFGYGLWQFACKSTG